MAMGSKQRIEVVAADLLARDGYAGTSMKAISEAADLPYGSIYHHFPGGKEEIAAGAIESVGAAVGELIERLVADGVSEVAMRSMFDFMADRLEASEWVDGCAVGTPALDGAAGSELVRVACERSFARMVTPMADALERSGVEWEQALDLATTIMAAYEGGTILARAQRSRLPIERACRSMVRLVEVFVPDVRQLRPELESVRREGRFG